MPSRLSIKVNLEPTVPAVITPTIGMPPSAIPVSHYLVVTPGFHARSVILVETIAVCPRLVPPVMLSLPSIRVSSVQIVPIATLPTTGTPRSPTPTPVATEVAPIIMAPLAPTVIPTPVITRSPPVRNAIAVTAPAIDKLYLVDWMEHENNEDGQKRPSSFTF
jgi:hypothetical protein